MSSCHRHDASVILSFFICLALVPFENLSAGRHKIRSSDKSQRQQREEKGTMATGSCSTPSPAADAGGMIEMDGVADFSIYPTASCIHPMSEFDRSYFMRLHRTASITITITGRSLSPGKQTTHLAATYKDVQGRRHRAGLT